jgi:hypothetical protein
MNGTGATVFAGLAIVAYIRLKKVSL